MGLDSDSVNHMASWFVSSAVCW